jgi:hypothetical protein
MMAAYVAAFRAWESRQVTALALLVPAIAVNLLYGQNGTLTVALLIAGMRLVPVRPVLGGILLGLLSYKPQFGVLVALALVASGSWRTAVAAGVTALLLVLASLAAFGIEPWLAWYRGIPEFEAILLGQRARLEHLMPTALSNALALGASDRVAGLIQSGVTILAAAAVWYAFRRNRGRPAIAVLAVSALLGSPYAFIYDLTLTGAAIALIAAAGGGFSAIEIAVVVAALALPPAMLLNLVPPVAASVNLALLIVLLRRVRPAAAPATEIPA